MNPKRKADLQRKLTLKAVPRPPADLADRIKNDIPKYLQPELERNRFSRSIMFNLRVAASILLVVASVFVAFEVLTPTPKRAYETKAAAPQLTPASMPLSDTASETITNTLARAGESEVQVEIAQAAPVAPQAAQPVAPPAAIPMPLLARNEGARVASNARAEGARVASNDRNEGARVASNARNESARVASNEREERALAQSDERDTAQPQVTDAAVAPAFVETAPVAPPPPPAAPAAAAPASRAAGLVREAYADTLPVESRKSVFGISVDPEVFGRIKNTIENGGRPDESAVNIEALVNYFAGASQRPVRRDVNLEVEASPAPVEMEGDHAVLRFSVDTVKTSGSSVPPIAKDARIEIDINPTAVESIHRIGGGDAIESQSALMRNVSVTGLYALELRPGIKSTQRIATVRLRYTSIANGRPQVIERTVHGHDLAKEWKRSSRRHRLASLGAMFGEALKGGSTNGTEVVARRAEELATQDPRDQRAKELAKAASATGGER